MLLAMLFGCVLTGQDASSPAEPPAPLPDVVVTAPANEGAVVLECRINRDGGMRDCVVISETPPGQGFGEAALEGARRARVSRDAFDRDAADAKVRFTMRFRLDD